MPISTKELFELLVDRYKDAPDDQVLSFGHWHNDPALGVPPHQQFVACMQTTVGEIRALAAEQVSTTIRTENLSRSCELLSEEGRENRLKMDATSVAMRLAFGALAQANQQFMKQHSVTPVGKDISPERLTWEVGMSFIWSAMRELAPHLYSDETEQALKQIDQAEAALRARQVIADAAQAGANAVHLDDPDMMAAIWNLSDGRTTQPDTK